MHGYKNEICNKYKIKYNAETVMPFFIIVKAVALQM
jgi:hypothetical protein